MLLLNEKQSTQEARSSKRLTAILDAAVDLASGEYRDFRLCDASDRANPVSLPSASTLSRARYRLDLFLMHCRRQERCQRRLDLKHKQESGTPTLASEHEWIALCSLAIAW